MDKTLAQFLSGITSLLLLSLGFGCNNQTSNNLGSHDYTNELINESSPYLLQHAHNPVNWHPWGEKALKKAKELNLTTVALLGKGGGPAKDITDHALVVPSDITARIQEAHILIGHILCEIIEKELKLV